MSKDDRDKPPTAKSGYCNPPAEHRFKPGVSGNPKGRPRKDAITQALRQQLAAEVAAEMRRLVPVRENGRLRRRSKMAIAASTVTNKAAKGELTSLEFVTKQLELADEHRKIQATKETPILAGMTAEEASAAYLRLVRGE